MTVNFQTLTKMKTMNEQEFKQRYYQLSIYERIAMFKEYCMEYGNPDDAIHEFDDDFFDVYFSNKMEVCRATFFGEINNWLDPYIRFNGYGNLESLTQNEALSIIEDALDDIYEYPDIWEQYINKDEKI